MAMVLSRRVDCFFCSHQALDFHSYSQHMTSFHQVKKSGVEVLLALQFLEEKDRASLVEKTKTQVSNFRGKEANKELVEAKEPKPKNKHLHLGGVGASNFRKRKSFVSIKDDAVSSKIKLFSQVKEATPTLSKPKLASRMKYSQNRSIHSLVGEKKPERLVNEMLMKTLEEHRQGQKTANDTISIFDEIFATNCPSDMDESFEGPFNRLFDEDTASEESSQNISSIEVQDQDGEGLEDKNEDYNASERKEETEETKEGVLNKSEELPTEEDLVEEEETEKKGEVEAEGRYTCSSCRKNFKFLTYLKVHQSSKSNCNSKEIKKKRQSMNVSRIGSF